MEVSTIKLHPWRVTKIKLFKYSPIWYIYDMIWYMIYLLTAIGLTPGGSSTVHIYTQTIHRTTQSTQKIHRTIQLTNWEACGPCPVVASYTMAFALQLWKKHGKTSVRVAEERQLAQTATILLEGSRFRNLCLKILFVFHTGTQCVQYSAVHKPVS